ncbi:acyl-CoA N-acyltransferase [Fusarium flagelliforme]|uniref:acyl-CoA N-acyltransferase n=1 Tax=Fusarium flagelliforme TaxID=2675880 RepID=UPI001E8D3337|nr:acyl-CoA N-acyltransferase [Fusarium flagelliforme]KAH7179076.1 acyl-CoA N-acyltransferase [Fusarium flagelliforme]
MTNDKPIKSFTLRTHQPGDMGYITYRHGKVYAKEYNFNSRFESLVSRITADFLDNFNPDLERCWIAEKDGQFLGSIMLVQEKKPKTAKLRLLLVEESARGLGVGTALIQACIDFAREAGYESVGLWTQSMLVGARRLYKKAGFELVKTEPQCDWGVDAVGEFWSMNL